MTINYRHCPLNEGRDGDVYGGDRLPWVAVNDSDNYEPLKAMTWQVHVYGTASPELRIWCDRRNLPLHVFAWRQEYGNVGFAQDGTYLIRPDTYVALATGSPAIGLLQRYLDKRGIHIEPSGATRKQAA